MCLKKSLTFSAWLIDSKSRAPGRWKVSFGSYSVVWLDLDLSGVCCVWAEGIFPQPRWQSAEIHWNFEIFLWGSCSLIISMQPFGPLSHGTMGPDWTHCIPLIWCDWLVSSSPVEISAYRTEWKIKRFSWFHFADLQWCEQHFLNHVKIVHC